MKLGISILLSSSLLLAEETALKVPTVEKLFFPGLPEFKNDEVLKAELPLELRVKSSSPTASAYTSAGFNYLHMAWDVEAYRFFCQAVREDENCLMAHVGIALSLASPFYHEMLPQRKAAVVRMMELVEVKTNGVYAFPEKERALALAIAHLFVEGRVVALQVFEQLTEKYPDDPQIPLLCAIFHRDGHDALGNPNSGERKALKMIEQIRSDNPTHPLAAQYLLSMYKEAPISVLKLRERALPVARKLAEEGSIAIRFHWLGVIEFRCGNLEEAEAAFRKADDALMEWKVTNGISNADATSLWRTKLFLAAVLMELGKKDEVEKIAQFFFNLKVDDERLWAAGSQLILWEGWTLASRINLAADGSGASEAMKNLATEKMLEPVKGKSAAIYLHDILHYYLALRKANEAKDAQAVLELKKTLYKKMLEFDKFKGAVARTGEAHSYKRGTKWLRQMTAVLKSDMETSPALKVLGRSDAINEESLPVGMLPPMSFFTFEEALIPMLVEQKKYDRAKMLISSAVERRPSSPTLWQWVAKVGKLSGDREWVVEQMKQNNTSE